ncbi:type II toxin-antitoxin system MqsA family antitoxin [Thiohalocapsa marina]|uniref:type II toxin-antitoxin system MqsA family antitoxin n=1 Tax=Thiohalocapsa marina TaxID=424902 RepID=UPI0036D9C5F0
MTNTFESKTCPICGEGHLFERQDQETVLYQGQEGRIPLAYSVCDRCGSEQASPEQLRSNKRAMIKFQKTIDGLLSGEAIDQFLGNWGITQSQAARIFGGGAVAFSKYKHDDVKQSEAMDHLLRVAAAVPDAFAWLTKRAGVLLPGTSSAYTPLVIKLASSSEKASPVAQQGYQKVEAFTARGKVSDRQSANESIYNADELVVG